ncbi:MAG: hypothetical protein COA54_15290 [Thiotrichaceae bacterium]|nr:MAG: hypothetical protein COA54_15290 [Thiotrichaceae bacterium]
MDKGKTILLNGMGDRTYVFTVYPWQTKLICSSLVYVVLRRDWPGYSVLYIGNTGMLSGHISDHPLLQKFNAAGKTHIGIHIEPSSFMREVKQKDLIINFMPTLNRD